MATEEQSPKQLPAGTRAERRLVSSLQHTRGEQTCTSGSFWLSCKESESKETTNKAPAMVKGANEKTMSTCYVDMALARAKIASPCQNCLRQKSRMIGVIALCVLSGYPCPICNAHAADWQSSRKVLGAAGIDKFFKRPFAPH